MKPMFVVMPCECVGGKNVIMKFKAIGIYILTKPIMDGVDTEEETLVFSITCPKCNKERRLRIPLGDIDKLLDSFVPYSSDFVQQDYVL